MGDRALGWAAAAAGLVAVALVLGGGGRAEDPAGRPRPPSQPVAPVVVGDGGRSEADRARAVGAGRRRDERRAAAEDMPVGARPRRAIPRRAVRTAARFAEALLRLERAPNDRAARGALRRSAAPRLARSLLSAPAAGPPKQRPIARGRVALVDPLPDFGRQRVEVLVTVDRAGRRSGMVLSLVRTRRGWRVEELS